MHEALGFVASDHRHAAHVHQQRTIAIQTHHAPLGLPNGHTQGDGRRVPHATHGQKVALLLAMLDAQLEYFARGLAGGGNDQIVFCTQLQQLFQRRFTRPGSAGV